MLSDLIKKEGIPMKGITSAPFGKTKAGEPVTAFTLENALGMRATVLDYGCTLVSIEVPDRAGVLCDVILGYRTLAEYEENDGYLGATVGRLANRLAEGRFTLGGKDYALFCNDGKNHLHGGKRGFDSYVWDSKIEGDSLCFSRLSPDGEEGYPGNLSVQVRLTFRDDGTLELDYQAATDADTLVSLTNHSYFNLTGSGQALSHTLWLNASHYTPVEGQIPTGELRPVEGTAFDFRQEKPIGRDIGAQDAQLRAADGYDHNFVLDGEGMRLAARLYSLESGIAMEVSTDLPGIQLYTANMLSRRAGKGTRHYGPHDAVCLETQQIPDAIHHENFPSPVLHAGEEWHYKTCFAFSIR